jgi:hypothetical protein
MGGWRGKGLAASAPSVSRTIWQEFWAGLKESAILIISPNIEVGFYEVGLDCSDRFSEFRVFPSWLKTLWAAARSW